MSDTLPEVAVIVTLAGKEANGPTMWACPFVGAELLIVTFESSVDQTTASVTSAFPPPAKVPVAVNGTVCPVIALTDEGEICTDTRFAAVTPTVVEPLMFAELALMVAEPGLTAVTSPVLLTSTLLGSDVLHIALLVISLTLPSS